MKRHHSEPATTHSEVTTEPQRLALEAMSHALVEKLNIMVAEQEKRAQEFTNLQHSLSSLPTTPQIPQVQQAEQTPLPQPKPKLPPVPRKEHAPQQTGNAQSKGLPNIPPLDAFDYTGAPRTPRRKPTIIKPQDSTQEEGIGVGTIITVVIIIFIIVAKGC